MLWKYQHPSEEKSAVAHIYFQLFVFLLVLLFVFHFAFLFVYVWCECISVHWRRKVPSAHINPTATQITWIAFCPVTPTTQTTHKKRSDAAQSKTWRTTVKLLCMQVLKATYLIFGDTSAETFKDKKKRKNYACRSLDSLSQNPWCKAYASPVLGNLDLALIIRIDQKAPAGKKERGICQKADSLLGFETQVVHWCVRCLLGKTPPPHLRSWPGIKSLRPASSGCNLPTRTHAGFCLWFFHLLNLFAELKLGGLFL